MNTATATHPGRKLLPESAGPTMVWMGLAGEIIGRGEDEEFSFEAIRVRAETVTPLLEESMHVHLPTHWGINE